MHPTEFKHRHLVVAMALAALATPIDSALAQSRPRATGPTLSAAAAEPTQVTVGVSYVGTGTGDHLLIKWQPAAGATRHVVSRSIPGGNWVDLPAQSSTSAGSPSYLDMNAVKLVLPLQAVRYRVTAIHPPQSATLRAGTATSAASNPVEWTRPAPPLVEGLTASNESGAGEVILKWSGYTGPPVHVYRDGQKITSIPLPNGANTTGELNVPKGKRTYHVAPAVEVTGQGWVIFPADIWKHATVQVDVQ